MAQRPEPRDPTVRRHMERQRRRDTGPEMALRRALHAAGFRFRVQYPAPGLPRRSIDIAFTKARVAVYIDGCFWHSCPEHGVAPKNNADWWADKLEQNRARDVETSSVLEACGWRVVRVWEHETVEMQVSAVVAALARSTATG